MKPIFFILASILFAQGYAQSTKHIVQLRNKKATTYSLQQPGLYLSAKALLRREKQGISIDSTDLPIPKSYLDSIANSGAVSILNTSKWLNQVLIQTTDAAALARINAFPFVVQAAPIANRPTGAAVATEKFNETISGISNQQAQRTGIAEDYFQYGSMGNQVKIHEGEFLHNLGYRGEGMTIAVLDAGYFGFLTNPAFDSIRVNGQVLGTWDFVKNESSVNEDNSHGMFCLSVMAANKTGVFVGTSPKAKYYLFRTEDAATEFPIEEQNWAAAAELADSLGVDLITSSLGYSQFDNPAFNHVYADMDGNTTMVTRAADFAARKGMIITNSAGNSGGTAWKYIIAPADGDSVLAVGAVNTAGQVAAFSSYGPSADGRVKPDISSVGWGTTVVSTTGNPASANGTSFSNPNIAGLITCLWQAFPDFSNMDILDAVKKSANQFSTPDDRMGHGIPNMRIAYEMLEQEKIRRHATKVLGESHIRIFPVPFQEQFTVLYKARSKGKLNLTMTDALGRTMLHKSIETIESELYIIPFTGLGTVPAGSYFLRYWDGEGKGVVKIIK